MPFRFLGEVEVPTASRFFVLRYFVLIRFVIRFAYMLDREGSKHKTRDKHSDSDEEKKSGEDSKHRKKLTKQERKEERKRRKKVLENLSNARHVCFITKLVICDYS